MVGAGGGHANDIGTVEQIVRRRGREREGWERQCQDAREAPPARRPVTTSRHVNPKSERWNFPVPPAAMGNERFVHRARQRNRRISPPSLSLKTDLIYCVIDFKVPLIRAIYWSIHPYSGRTNAALDMRDGVCAPRRVYPSRTLRCPFGDVEENLGGGTESPAYFAAVRVHPRQEINLT